MNDITHITQMISLCGQRLDRADLDYQERMEILQELDDLLFEIESFVKDELYAYEETIDGKHSSPF